VAHLVLVRPLNTLHVQRLVILVLALLIADTSFGETIPDTPENRQKQAERYLLAIPPKTLIEDIAVSMAAARGAASEREKIVHTLISQLDFDAVNRAIKNSLVKVFTADEIKAMADFYGSPAGKSAMSKTREYMTDLRPAVQVELAKAQAKAAQLERGP
jgi:hypothetical protein